MGLEKTIYYNDSIVRNFIVQKNFFELFAYGKNKAIEFTVHEDFYCLMGTTIQLIPFDERKNIVKKFCGDRFKEIKKCLKKNELSNKYINLLTSYINILYYTSDIDDLEDHHISQYLSKMIYFYETDFPGSDTQDYTELMYTFGNILSSLKISYLSELYYYYVDIVLNKISEPSYHNLVTKYYCKYSNIQHTQNLYLTSNLHFYIDYDTIKDLKYDAEIIYSSLKSINNHESYSDNHIIDLMHKSLNDEVLIKPIKQNVIRNLGNGLIKINKELYISIFNKNTHTLVIDSSISKEDIQDAIREILDYFEGLQQEYSEIQDKSASSYKIQNGYKSCVDGLNKIIIMTCILFFGFNKNNLSGISFSKRSSLKEKFQNLITIYSNSNTIIGLYHLLYNINDHDRESSFISKRNKTTHSFFGKIDKNHPLHLNFLFKLTLSTYQSFLLFLLEINSIKYL